MSGAGAEAGPCMVKVSGTLRSACVGGCRVRKAGTMIKKRDEIRGTVASKPGLRKQKVYSPKNERVCVGTLQEKSLISLFSKMKTIPTLQR